MSEQYIPDGWKLTRIDKILKRNKLEPKELEKAELESQITDSYTTFRIAKSVVDAFNWSISQEKS